MILKQHFNMNWLTRSASKFTEKLQWRYPTEIWVSLLIFSSVKMWS